MLIADISGRTLARLARRPAPGRGLPLRPAREHVEIDGTPAGTALTTQRIHVSRDEDGMWVHIPVSGRGEAVGVLPPSSSSTGTAPPASYPHSCRQRTGHLITARRQPPTQPTRRTRAPRVARAALRCATCRRKAARRSVAHSQGPYRWSRPPHTPHPHEGRSQADSMSHSTARATEPRTLSELSTSTAELPWPG